MAQIKRFNWTNPAAAVAKELSVGFTVTKIEIWDLTTPNRFEWTSDMSDDYIFVLGTLAYTTSNGVTPLSESFSLGPVISGMTNANPGVLTVDDVATYGIVAGDTITVTNLADDLTATSLNGDYVVASVTATTITTATNTAAYSVYVSGGTVVRKLDSDGKAVVQQNKAKRGLTLGTSAVGANDAVMVAVCYGEESVT